MKNNESIRIISVIGLGLIGASLASALCDAYTVYGSDADADAERFALEQGLIKGDAYGHLEESDLVIVATPVTSVADIIQKVFARVGTRAIISDVAGVKNSFKGLLPKGIRYVGGHPMAGKEKGGIRNYSPRLFENAVYVLTDGTEEDVALMQEMVAVIGALPVRATAAAHDAAVSKISHLTHMIAYILSSVALTDELAEMTAAGSFRDMTRVAASDPEFWTEIAFDNKNNLLSDMRMFGAKFDDLARMIEEGNSSGVLEALRDGKRLRDEMNERSIGSYDNLFVGIIDEPNALAIVTGILGTAGVNIANVGILKSREGLGGALKVSFKSREECAKAEEILKQAGYACSR